jgi:hypothetical protein
MDQQYRYATRGLARRRGPMGVAGGAGVGDAPTAGAGRQGASMVIE